MDVKKRGGNYSQKKHVVLYKFFFLGGGQNFVLYFFIGLLKHEVLKMHTLMFDLLQLFKSKLGIRNCTERGFFSGFFVCFFWGRDVINYLGDEPRYKNVDPPM